MGHASRYRWRTVEICLIMTLIAIDAVAVRVIIGKSIVKWMPMASYSNMGAL